MSGFGEHFGWVEMLVTGVIAFSFGFYQLWSVNREIKRDKEKQQADSDA